MECSGSNLYDIFEIYSRYCDIMSGEKYVDSREALAQLLEFVESRVQKRDRSLIFDDIFKLMSRLDLMVDSCQFTRFYDFVFFVCRENGQKNITLNRAIAAWKIVLAGRFRLLNQWCDFVEENQRHNISEDTWQQVLAFSRCVHEDLEGYDPKGAWPVLIDDFVEHMYRITRSNSCSTLSFGCNCGDSEAQPCISDDSLPGINVFSGSKRKSLMDFGQHEVDSSKYYYSPNSSNSQLLLSCKRNRTSFTEKPTNWDGNPPTDDCMEVVKNYSPLGSSNSSHCAIEGSLSKGFAGLLSRGSCLRFDQKRRVSYT